MCLIYIYIRICHVYILYICIYTYIYIYIYIYKHAYFSNGGLFWKSLVLFFRRTYALSVGFKINPLRKRGFPVLRQKPTQILL